MNISYLWMLVEIVLLVINYLVLNKYKEDLTYQNWVDWYFWLHKITTALPAIVLAWGGYIFLYDYFNSYEYYRTVYVDSLTLLSGYFVVIFLLFYLSENARKIYAFVRILLVGLNGYQIYYLYKFKDLLRGFDIARNVFRGGVTSGVVILALWAIIDILNCLLFIYYYKYNRYEMTN